MKHLHTIRNFFLATHTGKAVFMALAAIMAATTIAYAVQGRRGPKVTSISVERALLEIGDSYGGGIVAYILQPNESIGYIKADGTAGTYTYSSTVQHGLIAALEDESSTMAWIEGGSLQTTALGGTGTELGDGAANTVKILDASATGGAGKVCADKVDGGYSDWYLPSKDELNKLYMLHSAGVGGFAGADYWSSSEAGGSLAWMQKFSYAINSQKYDSKPYALRVRAVRAF